MKKEILVFFCLIFICSPLFFYGCGSDDDTKGTPSSINTFKADTKIIEKTKLPIIKVFPGRVRSKVQIVLAAKMPGFVKKVPVQIGQEVKEGDLLVAIDDTDVKAKIESLYAMRRAALGELNAIEAKYQYAKINYDRFKKLYKQNSATKDELDRAKTQFETLKNHVKAINSKISSIEAQIKEAQNQLSYLRIRAPISGWISERMVDPGTYVNPGQPLIKLDGKGVGFWFEAEVDESLIKNVHVGDQVIVLIPSLKELIDAKIEHVQNSTNQNTNTFTLLVDLDDRELKSGVFGRVIIKLGEVERIILPENVIVKRSGIYGVYVVDEDNICHWRIIRPGKMWILTDGRLMPILQDMDLASFKESKKVFVTILSGINPGEKVVVSNLAQVREGARLE